MLEETQDREGIIERVAALDIGKAELVAYGTEAKIVTGVDDCSRFCVIATVLARATGRAVCLAFAAALRRYGIPDEVLTDIQTGWRSDDLCFGWPSGEDHGVRRPPAVVA
jgi:hypothetical protein